MMTLARELAVPGTPAPASTRVALGGSTCSVTGVKATAWSANWANSTFSRVWVPSGAPGRRSWTRMPPEPLALIE